MSAPNWKHKDEWKKPGKDFLIVVSRHEQSADFECGAHRWCVYAYIYPRHPYFAEFDGPNMWQDAASNMPLHAGPSLLEYPMHDGKVTSIKVGADYNHLHDSHFTHYATADEASEVFDDAEQLHAFLTRKAEASNG